MMRFLRFVVFLWFCSAQLMSLCAQDHDHSHLRNEIGFSGGVIYTLDHETWGGGVHVHYFCTLGLHSKWALGCGIEQTWSEGGHFTVCAGAKYQVFDRLSIGLMPGITFIKHDEHDSANGYEQDDSDSYTRFSTHVELVYDLFHWEKFHLGPTLDYSWSKDDTHFMLGLHIAYCF